MPRTRTRPKTGAAKKTTAGRGSSKTAAPAAPPAETGEDKAAASEAKRQERENLEAEQTQEVLNRFGEHPAVGGGQGDESLSTVANSLNITSGKAAFLLMKHAVKEGKVPSISGKDDETLLKAINTARLAADRFSSWGWLAARAGKSEGFIKNGLEELGLYTPRAENIASKRSEATKAEKAAAAPAAATTNGETKKSPRRRRSGNA